MKESDQDTLVIRETFRIFRARGWDFGRAAKAVVDLWPHGADRLSVAIDRIVAEGAGK